MTGANAVLARPDPAGPGRLSRAALRYGPPVVVAIAFLALWELWTGGSPGSIFPPPSAILAAGIEEQSLLLASARATFIEAIGGLLLGTLAGVIVAFAAARWVITRDILLPLAIGASAVPLIAVAPILNNWFGITNPLSKMLMAALLVFFPVMISVTRGLVEVPPSALELMRSYAATQSEVLRKVRAPNALPYFFTALKVGTTLAFIGAIVAEYFGGTSEVLGRVVITSMFSGKFDVAWAGIAMGAVAAIIAYAVVSAIERVAIPWYISLRAGEA